MFYQQTRLAREAQARQEVGKALQEIAKGLQEIQKTDMPLDQIAALLTAMGVPQAGERKTLAGVNESVDVLSGLVARKRITQVRVLDDNGNIVFDSGKKQQ
jgi:hypothetical protein